MFNLDLSFITSELSEYSGIRNMGVGEFHKEGPRTFRHYFLKVWKLIFIEKEIFIFALIQWVIVLLAYYLWLQIIAALPISEWIREEPRVKYLLDFALTGWLFLLTALAAFPIGILTGCMGAAHYIRQSGQKSTIAYCFRLILPHIWRLWQFHWIDGQITVERIMERLPERGNWFGFLRKTPEDIYYHSWKCGTVGLFPAILSGQNIYEAGRESIRLVKERTGDVIKLRGGYSYFCWELGILTYIVTVFWFILDMGIRYTPDLTSRFFLITGVPVVIAAGIIMLFLRPVFIIASCEIYARMNKDEGGRSLTVPPPSQSVSNIVTFSILGLVIAAIFLVSEKIGIIDFLPGL